LEETMKPAQLLPVALLLTSCAGQESTGAPTVAPNVANTGPSPASSASSNPDAKQGITVPVTPEAIAVPSGQRVVLKALAKGVQIYACKAKEGAPSAYEWTLKAPEAELFDDGGQKIGKHYGGPTWEAADGSKVVGKLKTKVDAPEPTAIPWLLLEAKSTEGAGVLSKVTNIQRVATVGGKAPPGGCDAAHANAETRVDYTASYYMYGP
jgi:hypothetical protein